MSELNILLLRRRIALGWEANRSVGYCLPCVGAAVGAGQNEFCCEKRHPSDDIKPAALENESLDEERSDNIEPACELASESDSGEDDNCDDAEYLPHPLI